MSDPIEFLSRCDKRLRLVALRRANGLPVGLLAVFVLAGCSAGIGPTPSQGATYAATSTPTAATSTATATTATLPVPTSTHGPAGFSATGSMTQARTGHTATRLPDGRVLIVGGEGDPGAVASAELWRP